MNTIWKCLALGGGVFFLEVVVILLWDNQIQIGMDLIVNGFLRLLSSDMIGVKDILWGALFSVPFWIVLVVGILLFLLELHSMYYG